jgi:hypothetical protein
VVVGRVSVGTSNRSPQEWVASSKGTYCWGTNVGIQECCERLSIEGPGVTACDHWQSLGMVGQSTSPPGWVVSSKGSACWGTSFGTSKSRERLSEKGSQLAINDRVLIWLDKQLLHQDGWPLVKVLLAGRPGSEL